MGVQERNNRRERGRQRGTGKSETDGVRSSTFSLKNGLLSNIRPGNGDAVGSAAANYIIYSPSFAKVDTGRAPEDWSRTLF